jgi:hypothetical protein
VALTAIAVCAALPANASADPCPVAPGVFSTSWVGGSGHYNTDLNWSNGAPSAVCDASITAAGSYTVTMNGGSVMKSMTIGGAGSNPTLQISAENVNTNLLVAAGGFLNIASGASLTLICNVPAPDCGAPNVSAPTITNAGAFTVDTTVDGQPGISGTFTNTGIMQFNHMARFDNGAVTNQGTVNIADATTVVSSGSSCGDTGVSFKNDTGGSINATGTGTLDVIFYEQGNGSAIGSNPVQMPCGGLKYTGNGASKVRARGGFELTGTMQSNQSLTVSDESSNTAANLGGPFTNNGTITLTCPLPVGTCGAGGGADFNGAGHTFTNAGILTVSADAGTGAVVNSGGGGTIVNTGTMNFDQSGALSGVVTNQGAINIANGKMARSSGSSCGDPGGSVKNDTGGSINAIGTGTFEISTNYEQGNGTTSGTTPVNIPCGGLQYTGNGTSVVQAGGTTMTGSISSGQTLRIRTNVNSPAFSNAGTIVFDQSATNPILNLGGTLTNTGTIATSGASANTSTVGGGSIDQTNASAQVIVLAGTNLNIGGNPLLLKAGKLSGDGTLTGSVNNSAGTVAPGASPGTLTVSGNYTQGASGKLEVEIAGTGAGQFDRLAVGGNANLDGDVSLQPSAGYAASAAVGDSLDFLAYGGTRTGGFASTTVSATLTCPNQLSVAYDDTAKEVNASVSSTGASCTPPDNGGGNDNKPPPPDTVLGAHPKPKVKAKKGKAKVKFTFSATVAGATFQCKLDKRAFTSCASPKFYRVKRGKHKFSVRAVGPGGVVDPTPASFSFKVIKKKVVKKKR